MEWKYIAEKRDEDTEETLLTRSSQSSSELKQISKSNNGNFVDLTGSPSPPLKASRKPIPTSSPAELANNLTRAHGDVRGNVIASPSDGTETTRTTSGEPSLVPVKAEADTPKSAIRNRPLSSASQRTNLVMNRQMFSCCMHFEQSNMRSKMFAPVRIALLRRCFQNARIPANSKSRRKSLREHADIAGPWTLP